MRVRLYLSTYPLAEGRYGVVRALIVNLEQLTDSTVKLALEIPPLVHENLREHPKLIVIVRRLGCNLGC